MVNDGVDMLNYLARVDDDSDDSVPRPDIILLDLNMPRKDGRQALQEIRAKETGRTIPIIVFSTSDNVKDIKGCYAAGCNSYITKPSELDEFNTALEHVAAYWLEINALP